MNTDQYPQQGTTPVLSTSAMAIAGLVVGIIGLLGSAIPILNNVAFFIAILGLIFGIIGLVSVIRGKRRGKGLAIAAVVISVVAIVVVLATQSLYSSAIDEATDDTSFATTEQSADSDSQDSSSSTEVADQSSDYTITDEKYDTSDYLPFISGTFTNNTDSDFSYVSVEYALYDKDGAKIDSAIDSTDGLKAGGTWKYEAHILSDADDVESYEMTDVTYW